MVIAALSPRSTALYHTLDSRPRDTSPNTTAPGSMNAVGWIKGLLTGAGVENLLGPGGYRLAVLLGRIILDALGKLHRQYRKGRIVRRREHCNKLHRTVCPDLDANYRLAWCSRDIGGQRHERRRLGLGLAVKTSAVCVVARPQRLALADEDHLHGHIPPLPGYDL